MSAYTWEEFRELRSPNGVSLQKLKQTLERIDELERTIRNQTEAMDELEARLDDLSKVSFERVGIIEQALVTTHDTFLEIEKERQKLRSRRKK